MKTHILLIDDDKDELNIFIEALNRVNIPYKCTWAQSGEQALKQLPYITPDIIFLDLNMPAMDGFMTLAHIKKLVPRAEAPVILYSNGMNREASAKGSSLGATACIAKPGSIDELAVVLTALLNEIAVVQG